MVETYNYIALSSCLDTIHNRKSHFTVFVIYGALKQQPFWWSLDVQKLMSCV